MDGDSDLDEPYYYDLFFGQRVCLFPFISMAVDSAWKLSPLPPQENEAVTESS